MRLFATLSLAVYLTAGGPSVFAQSTQDRSLGVVEDFRLPDHTGRSHQLSRYGDAPAVVLFYGGNGCPIVRKSIPELKRLRDEWAPKGVVFLMVNANSQDTRADIAREAQEYAVDMPVLLDAAGLVTHMLGVTRTAEALVVVPKDLRLVYRGAIDDRFGYGTSKAEPEHCWLADALRAVMDGRPADPARTDNKGCLIDVPDAPTGLEYVRDVAPVLEAKCIRCHSEGQVAPFSFDDYDDVRGWAPMIREVVLTQRMPPWHADPAVGRFANDHGLAPDDARKLATWARDGAPRGEGDDPLLKAARPTRTDWPLGTPDRIVSLEKEVELPAEGVLDYMYFRVPSGLTEDAWLRAVDVRPTNRKVVHHVLVFVEYPVESQAPQRDMRGGLDGYFAAYVPGQEAEPFPDGTGKFVPKGSSFIFQMHYTATGKPEKDQTRLGLYLHAVKPPKEIETHAVGTTEFVIPAGADNHVVTASHTLERGVVLQSLSPHMHYRGSWFEYEARYPDGRRETLLSVPHYDFGYQALYRLAEPKALPAGATLVCTGGFDNSPRNPANPDPKREVRFGEQTWDEMFIGYVDWTASP